MTVNDKAPRNFRLIRTSVGFSASIGAYPSLHGCTPYISKHMPSLSRPRCNRKMGLHWCVATVRSSHLGPIDTVKELKGSVRPLRASLTWSSATNRISARVRQTIKHATSRVRGGPRCAGCDAARSKIPPARLEDRVRNKLIENGINVPPARMVSKSVGCLEISPKKLIRQRWAEHHSEIGSAERDIEPGQTPASIDPVNDAAHRARAPQAR
jgi:hypothetical protein